MCMGGFGNTLDLSPSTRRWAVEVYVPQDPPQESPVVFAYIVVSVQVGFR
jgi:hypothetical protein